MKRFLPIAAVFLMLMPLQAEWNDFGLTLTGTGPSTLDNALKFELRDRNGLTFFVNSPGEPDRAAMKKILNYKDDILSWKHVAVKELSFFMYEKGLQARVVPASINYKGTDLKAYLPSGFTFMETKDSLQYGYRIIVGSTSLKLDGDYAGEEPMLEEMSGFIRGINEGRIIVEDEKVVSGSVVAITRDRNKGDRRVHPVRSFADIGTGPQGDTGGGRLKLYATAQGSYLVPIGFFSDIFLGGYGSTVSIGLCDLGFSFLGRTLFKFDLEFTTGYWYLAERKQKDDDYDNYSIHNAFIVPLGLTARYRIGITAHTMLSPSLNFGYYYNQLEYVQTPEAGSAEAVSTREFNPALTPGVRLDYRFDRACVFAGADLMFMFERRLNIATMIVSLGGGWSF